MNTIQRLRELQRNYYMAPPLWQEWNKLLDVYEAAEEACAAIGTTTTGNSPMNKLDLKLSVLRGEVK